MLWCSVWWQNGTMCRLSDHDFISVNPIPGLCKCTLGVSIFSWWRATAARQTSWVFLINKQIRQHLDYSETSIKREDLTKTLLFIRTRKQLLGHYRLYIPSLAMVLHIDVRLATTKMPDTNMQNTTPRDYVRHIVVFCQYKVLYLPDNVELQCCSSGSYAAPG